MQSSIFLCHSSSDREFAGHLANDLKEHSIEAWLDDRQLGVGASISDRIESAILESSWLVVVLSESAVNSDWVRSELNAALELEREKGRDFVLPILLEPCETPLFLRNKVYADFSSNYQTGLKKLLRTLKNPDVLPTGKVGKLYPKPQRHSPAKTSGERGRRVGEVIHLINEATSYRKIPVSVFAERLGFEHLNDLENYIDGTIEPSVSFFHRFCEMCGASPEWVKHGQGSPFSPQERVFDPLDCLEKVRKYQPEKVFLVRSSGVRGEAGVVLKLDKFRFVTFCGDWPISSLVGASGARRIFHFYKLINELRSIESGVPVFGCLLKEEEFRELASGQRYAGLLERWDCSSLWWDDFADIENPHLSRKQLESSWGKEFVLAQDIARSYLKD